MIHFHAFYENEGYGGDIIDVNLPCPDPACTLPDKIYFCPSPAMHFPARDTIILDWNTDDDLEARS